MTFRILALGCATAALFAGAAVAQQTTPAPSTTAATRATGGSLTPSRPIPYSQLGAYMKASPQVRATRDWWAADAAAQTARPGNASATVGARTPGLPGDINLSTGAAPTLASPPSSSSPLSPTATLDNNPVGATAPSLSGLGVTGGLGPTEPLSSAPASGASPKPNAGSTLE